MKLEKNVIDEIIIKTNLVELIGEYVSLKLTGKNYKGLCPFHQEKTPSFSVSADGFYHCFGCGESGNAIKFLQKYLNLSFIEAVAYLANRCGINIKTSTIENTREGEIKQIYQIAQEFYSMLLFQPPGDSAYEYFTQRKVSPETMKQFGLGFSPDKFDNLYNDLKRKGFTEEILIESKIVAAKNNKIYDFFRNRAMFPIKDFLGRTVAFGGRQLSENKLAGKYVNSAESLIYDKKSILFGLFEAKNEIRKTDEAFIVEGYLDVISLWQAGIKNVVAPCGTALTFEQLNYLKKHTNVKTIYFLFDGDFAGKNAALRSISPALEIGFDLRIINLPPGQDPDTIINQEDGIFEFEKHKRHFLSFVDFISKNLADEGKLTTPAEKSAAIKAMINLIWKIKDKPQHNFYLDNISEIFDYPAEVLAEFYEKNNPETSAKLSSIATETKSREQLKKPPGFLKNPTINELFAEEKFILKLAVLNANNFRILVKNHNISENIFITDLAKAIFETIYEFWDSENLLQEILQSDFAAEHIKSIVSQLKLEKIGESNNWKKFADIDNSNNSSELINKALAKLRVKSIEEEQEFLRKMSNFGDENTLNQWLKLQIEKQNILNTELRYE